MAEIFGRNDLGSGATRSLKLLIFPKCLCKAFIIREVEISKVANAEIWSVFSPQDRLEILDELCRVLRDLDVDLGGELLSDVAVACTGG